MSEWHSRAILRPIYLSVGTKPRLLLAGGTNALYAGFTALHELIHAITDSGDPELAKAVFDIGKGNGSVPTNADLTQDPYAYSRLLERRLEVCMYAERVLR